MARTLLFLIALLAAWPAAAQRVALTFDDGLDPAREPRAAAWYGAIPFLKDGDTAEKRDGVREWMRAHGYRPGIACAAMG